MHTAIVVSTCGRASRNTDPERPTIGIGLQTNVRVVHAAEWGSSYLLTNMPHALCHCVRLMWVCIFFYHRCPDVAESFIHSARFTIVRKPGRILAYRMSHLVCAYIQRGERRKAGRQAGAIAIDHLCTIPERIVEADRIMDITVDRRGSIVKTIAALFQQPVIVYFCCSPVRIQCRI